MLLRYIVCFLLSTATLSVPLASKASVAIEKSLPTKELREKIKQAQQTKEYEALGVFLQDTVQNKLDLKVIRRIAWEVKERKLLQASRFALALDLEKEKIEFRQGDLLQIALFIETKLPQYVSQGKFYLTSDVTGLSQTIEYDPETQKCFILLDGVKGSYIGKGAAKKVVKSILYDPLQPEILARAEQSRDMQYEVELMKQLQGLDGIFVSRAFTQHTSKNTTYSTVYSNFYNLGSLERALDYYIFTLQEKMKITLDILTGLSALHEKKIIHRDIRAANCLIQLDRTKGEKSTVRAAIADFGCSIPLSDAYHVVPHAVRTYWPPNALLPSKLEGSDYFDAEIFSTGCVLYRLYFEKDPPWRKVIYYHNKVQTISEKQDFLTWKILTTMKSKYRLLTEKKEDGIIDNQEKAFASLILRMIHPSPSKRGTAEELRKELFEIYNNKN
jgi:serine/threonine protein kinase